MSDPQPSAKPTVLVVEDEAVIRMCALVALEDAGFEVLEAEHAAAALVHLGERAEDVAVVCTDVHMPGEMNGVALAHHAFRHWPWIGVLVMSGKAYPPAAELPEGARFLPKPYALDTLVCHVQEMAAA